MTLMSNHRSTVKPRLMCFPKCKHFKHFDVLNICTIVPECEKIRKAAEQFIHRLSSKAPAGIPTYRQVLTGVVCVHMVGISTYMATLKSINHYFLTDT